VFEEVRFFVGSDLMFKPFYGKLTLFNRWVIHGEVYLLLGFSLFNFSTGFFRPALNLGGGGRVFANKWVSFRLELTNNIVIPTGGTSGFVNVMTTTVALALNFGGTE
jgi:outer membrane beta-barrel protein